MPQSLAVDTLGRRLHVEWDPLASVTPLGQLVFFCQFLAASGLYASWVANCPLRYDSPNAPAVRDVLGTSVLAILSGACRYAHVTALRGDRVNPPGLGMEKVVSEDSLRRAFQKGDAAALAGWQTEALLATYGPALEQPWIADLDVTVKPVYGHQEGAELGYNPHKPGRPSQAYHTVFLRTLRVALDVEVRSGKEHAAGHGLDNLWRLWDRLPPAKLSVSAARYQGRRAVDPPVGTTGRLANRTGGLARLRRAVATDRLDAPTTGGGFPAKAALSSPPRGVALAGTRRGDRGEFATLRIHRAGHQLERKSADAAASLPATSGCRERLR
jgi:hypothetical protein